MASQVKLTFDWENNDFFEMTAKHGEDEKIQIVCIEENANITEMWDSISTICKNYAGSVINKIGTEMKK